MRRPGGFRVVRALVGGQPQTGAAFWAVVQSPRETVLRLDRVVSIANELRAKAKWKARILGPRTPWSWELGPVYPCPTNTRAQKMK